MTFPVQGDDSRRDPKGIDAISFDADSGRLEIEGWYDQVAFWQAATFLSPPQRRALAVLLSDIQEDA